MNITNVEFKAKIDEIGNYESKLLSLHPEFKGTDHQIDTYFNAPSGRLKLREGNIENALIHYDREDIAGSKVSRVILYKHVPDPGLKNILIKQLGVKTVVDKKRKIYFIENVKFHFDLVAGLGTFMEVEAIDEAGTFTKAALQVLCDHYLAVFKIRPENIIDKSYSDLMMEQLAARRY